VSYLSLHLQILHYPRILINTSSRISANMRHNSNKAITVIANHFNAGNQIASIQTTCHAGTHRSVAAAEIVAGEMRRRDVNVVVTHAHLRRGVGDAR